jgi:hypothetical protein
MPSLYQIDVALYKYKSLPASVTPLFSIGQQVPTKKIKQTNELISKLISRKNTRDDSVIHNAVLKTIDSLRAQGILKDKKKIFLTASLTIGREVVNTEFRDSFNITFIASCSTFRKALRDRISATLSTNYILY